ncbi:transcription elongation factor GreA [Candidatus Bandiella numerosa]|jgi:transcription elongation factor GreA|uniref:transcription elongation factor GreA n=1 Tax=Candidatus Bandiella numerosa TaxID=2570586 RepID=UPI00249DB172|nr:transcription elongation factor GreA [Candidatus Bandiella numerosa]MBY0580416.1 transcription elongation factor GreA [Rickettsiales bacterium]WHA04728.1 transcription elongation factor GreA [Candidatus Bandiella numerosa]
MVERFPISKEGMNKLRLELMGLKNIERVNVIKSIAEAREHGDLSENAEYHAAREKQGFIEAKISELEDKISRAEVIDITKIQGSEIKYGASIKLFDEEKGDEVFYKIVSEYEADVSKGLISISSPLAKALIGKKVNESLEFKTPKGVKYYQIKSVDYI